MVLNLKFEVYGKITEGSRNVIDRKYHYENDLKNAYTILFHGPTENVTFWPILNQIREDFEIINKK